MPFWNKRKFYVSRELYHLAVERGAEQSARAYLEGAFQAQFNIPMIITVVIQGVPLDETAIDIPGYQVEWID